MLGLTFAILASLGSGIGSAVEAFGVRRAAASGERPGDLGPLLHQPIYFAGLTVDLLGFVFSVIALQLLPLFLVQAIVAASVGVTAVIVALSGRPLGRPAWIALCASLGGLVLLAVSSEPHDGGTLAVGWQWLLLGMCVPLAGLGAIGLRLTGTWSAVLLALVAAVSFTTNTVLPAAIGILFLGDHVRSGYVAVATAGFLIAVSGAIALAQFSGPMPADTAQPVRARA